MTTSNVTPISSKAKPKTAASKVKAKAASNKVKKAKAEAVAIHLPSAMEGFAVTHKNLNFVKNMLEKAIDLSGKNASGVLCLESVNNAIAHLDDIFANKLTK